MKLQPVYLLEMLIALCYGILGILGVNQGIAVWRARNGGNVTRWAVIVLTGVGSVLCMFALAMILRWHLDVHIVSFIRVIAWTKMTVLFGIVLYFLVRVAPQVKGR